MKTQDNTNDLTLTVAAVLVGVDFFEADDAEDADEEDDFCVVLWALLLLLDLPPADEDMVGVVEGAGVTQGLEELCEVTLGAGELAGPG